MPRFAILVSRDVDGWWKYSLVVDWKILPNEQVHAAADAAFKAALNEANRRGVYDVR